ncbi:MAG: M48 family metallopeptidase [Planctomycetota bacterium]|nr:M48 family metallopeptidase [Planctomycetota bacterium]
MMTEPSYGIQCPACKFAFKVKPEWAGRTGRCPQCKGPIVIPSPPAAPGAAPIVAAAPDARPSGSPPTVQATAGAAQMDLSSLRSPNESLLRTVCLVFAIVIYLVLLLTIVGILYFGIIVAASWIGLAIHLCHVRGNGIKVGRDQLPQVYASVCRAAKALGLAEVPDVYVIQEGGVLNAFATKWAFRNYIVLYSDLVDACGDDSGELDMVVAHEMGHLALKHITWHWILLPAMMVPFLSQAYSRACEYSADRCGWTGCRNKQAAMRGLVILAAGGHCGRMASLEAFLKQRHEVDGFWQIVVGLFSTHPWLTHRVEAVSQMAPSQPQA